MTTYIVRRLAQAIPLLFIISIILFALMQSFGDPVAMLGRRTPPRAEDKERLRRQLGLDQPMHIQYLTWLIGNDWQKLDMDGDGIPETPGVSGMPSPSMSSFCQSLPISQVRYWMCMG